MKEREDVGSVDEFPVGEFRIVHVGRCEIGVLRTSDGSFYAVLNYCPHRGAPICRGKVGGTMLPSAPGELKYGMEDRILRCPWHAFEFDLESGSSVLSDSRLKLRTYPIKVVDGRAHLVLDPKSK